MCYIFGGMRYEKYIFQKIKEAHDYQFFSFGPKGKIKKKVCIKCTNWQTVPIFVLGFGDWNSKKRIIDDRIVTNNMDRQKVLSTVAAVILDFLNERPGSYLYAKGSTPGRTRLYQMGINLVFEEIKDKLTVYGEIKGHWKKFSKGINYDSFLLKSKNP